jgi:acyl transferase domain-containing protein/acyl carrier protein
MMANSLADNSKLSLEKKRALLKLLLAQEKTDHSNQAIAIVGVQGRYPLAQDLDEYWENLKNGKNCIREIPKERWDWAQYYNAPLDRGGSYSKWGGFIDGVDQFDPLFFQMAPTEAAEVDPQERLFLELVWALLEDAAITRKELAGDDGKVGVFVGVMNGNYTEYGGNLAYWSIANRVSYFFNLHGPSLAIDTACSSSLTAIHLACESIWREECNAAIAGGVNLILHPSHFNKLAKLNMLSLGNQCRPFGEGADGFVDGEGVGAVYLKPLSRALAAGDHIYAVIKGTAVNAGGKTSGFTVPNPNAQTDLIWGALEKCGVDPRTISYVEAHGTGTALGDPIEIAGLTKAFYKKTDERQFCAIGSVKSNIGHLESAAGIAGLTKVLLQMKNKRLVPSLYSGTINPNIDLKDTPFYIPQELTEWKQPRFTENGIEQKLPRRAVISSFGAGGANACIILEEFEAIIVPSERDLDGAFLVPVSSRNEERLRAYVDTLAGFIERRSATDLEGHEFCLADLAYTLQTGREEMPARLAIIATDLADLLAKLRCYHRQQQGAGGIYWGKANRFERKPDMESQKLTEQYLQERELHKLAELWVTGAEIDWRLLYRNRSQRKLALPTYCFARQRSWLSQRFDFGAGGETAEPVNFSAVPDVRNRQFEFLYKPTWERVASGAPADSDGMTGSEPRQGPALIVYPPDGETLAETLIKHYWPDWVSVVKLGAATREISGHSWEINIHDPYAFQNCMPRLSQIRQIYFLGGIQTGAFEIDDLNYLEQSQELGVIALFRLIKCLTDQGLEQQPLQLTVVTNNVYPVMPEDTVRPYAASMAGLALSAAKEFPKWRVRVVDVDREETRRPGRNFEALTRFPPAEPDQADSILAFRNGDVYHNVFRRIMLPPFQRFPFKNQGVYLILGGAGGIGMELSKYLAEQVQARLILLGRSEPTPEQQKNFLKLEELGGAVLYIRADAADLNQMRNAVAKGERYFGTINGVFHTAIVLHDKALLNMDEQIFREPLGPKISGSVILYKVLQGKKLDFLIFFSSALSFSGNAGQSNYAAGCAFKDSFAHYLQQNESYPVLLINWGFWGSVGVAAHERYNRAMAVKGLRSINPEEGMEIVARVLAGRVQQIMPLKMQPKTIEALNAGPPNQITLHPQYSPLKTEQFIKGPPSQNERLQYLNDRILYCLAAVLQISRPDFDYDTPFTDFGVDSILAIAVINQINNEFGSNLRTTDLFNYPCVRELAGHLAESFMFDVQPNDCRHNPFFELPDMSVPPPQSAVTQSQSKQGDPLNIAITGISGRFPDAAKVEDFWSNLSQGKNCVHQVTRWDLKDFYDPDSEAVNKSYCEWGGFLAQIDKFDSLFFNISPKEAEVMDPQQRLFLTEAWQALEDAGYAEGDLARKRCGVFVGCGHGDYQQVIKESGRPPEAYSLIGNASSILSARLSYYLNLKGPSISIDTACSSALVAVHLACESIRGGTCDLALAGGVSIWTTPGFYIAGSKAGMLSRQGQCRAFDQRADGFVPGEGVGVVVLKPLERALQDGDHIYGVIKGSAINQDGKTNGITAPSAPSQTALECEVYEKFGINPDSISYVEAHGTGTELGDPIEMAALNETFHQYTKRKQYCAIGSVKSNIGHTLTAAGIAGLIKVLLCLKHRKLVPSLHFEQGNRHINFQEGPFYVNTELKEWLAQPGIPRLAAISSFGFSGTNAHMVIEEYVQPETDTDQTGREPWYMIPFSAKTAGALRRRMAEFVAWLSGEGAESRLEDISYTLFMGRNHYRFRSAFIADDITGLKNKIAQILDGKTVADYRTAVVDEPESNQFSRARDEELMNDLCQASLGKNDYLARLLTLAEWYVGGSDLDWGKLYRRYNYKRISLPTYPWAEESHWAAPLAATADAVLNKFQKPHPLIDENTSSLREQKFTTEFTGTEFFLVDHVVGDQRVLPGAASIEMARAAAEISGESKVAAIKNIYWIRPIIFTDKLGPLQTGIHPNNAGGDYEIFSLAETGPRVTFARGELIFAGKTAPTLEAIDLEALLKRFSRSIKGEEYYREFAKNGLKYGPSFQVIKEIFPGKHETLAYLELPERLEGTFRDYGLHPVILDGALQTVAGLTDNLMLRPGTAYIPFSLGEIDLSAAIPPRCFVHAVPAGTDSRKEALVSKFNIQILSETGQVLVRIKDFAVRPFPANSQVGPDSTGQLSFYRSRWEPSAAVHSEGETETARPVILFDTTADIAEALVQQPGMSGKIPVVLVKPGEHCFRHYRSRYECYEINPERPEDYRKLLASLPKDYPNPGRIVHLWAKSAYRKIGEDLSAQLCYGIYSIFHLIQALLAEKYQERLQLLFVYPGSRELPVPLYAAVNGFVKTLTLENPGFGCKTVMIDPDIVEPGILLTLIRREWREITPDNREISYDRGGGRWVKRLRETGLVANVRDDPGVTASLKEQGVYLITGGIGGLGMVVAAYLAQQYHAKLVLAGRSGLNPDSGRRIAEFQTWGAEVEYIEADISNRNDVTRLIGATKARFRKLNGIIHCAGITRDGFVLNKRIEELNEVLAAKVFGAIWLDEVTRQEALDCFVLFSSAASILGNIGQSDYAYANCFMDYYGLAREERRKNGLRQGKTLVINWPFWEEGGMRLSADAVDLMRQKFGIVSLSTGEGLRVLEEGLRSSLTQFMVLSGSPVRIRSLLSAPPAEFPKQAAAELPEGESADQSLRKKTEAYLKQLMADEIKLSTAQISAREPFETYGVDSVMVMSLNRKLERDFGEISKTLFFEYRNVSELVNYFLKNHCLKLRELLNQPFRAQKERLCSAPDSAGADFTGSRFGNQALTNAGASAIQGQEIAIVGISGRYPMAADLKEFWCNLQAGKDCIVEIPHKRWDYRKYYHPDKSRKGKSYSKWGGFIDDVDKFDPLFFNISPKEAVLIDPQERLFLETVWHTLEDAAYTRVSLADAKVGVFVGVMYGQYQLLGANENTYQTQMVTGSSYASIANRVSYFCNFSGPSIALDTMCSSSLTAIHLACESIRSGEIDAAIAGGVNLTLHPNKYFQLSQAKFASSDGRCRSFGKGGDGYVPGEGVGAVFLKPLNQAISDGDHIYAVIKGSSINHGGKTNGYTVPSLKAQSGLIARVLRKTGVNPRTIGYIEAHGTGTALGDPIEIDSLAKLYQPDNAPSQYCPIGSVKSNIGHLESAAGIAGLTKIILQMQHRQLVPSLHAEELNPNINFEASPFFVQRQLSEWKATAVVDSGVSKEIPRRAAISSFGAGGANAHMIIEEYQAAPVKEHYESEAQIVVLSAGDETVLKRYAVKLKEFLAEATNKQAPENNQTALMELVKDELITLTAEILGFSAEEVAAAAEINELDFEQLSFQQLVQHIQGKYQLPAEELIWVDYHSLNALARYLVEQYQKVLTPYYGITIGNNEITDSAGPVALSDLAYTLQAGREAMNERVALVVSDVADLRSKLARYIDGEIDISDVYRGNIKNSRLARELFENWSAETLLEPVIKERDLVRLARLWVHGFEIDWKRLYPERTPRRISLPAYPFARERYWVKPENDDSVIAPAAKDESAEEGDNSRKTDLVLLEKRWEEKPLGSGSVVNLEGTILMIVNDETIDLAEAIFLKSAGVRPVLLHHCARVNRPIDCYEVDFTHERQVAETIEAILKHYNGSIKGVIDFSDLHAQPVAAHPGDFGKVVLLQKMIKALNRQALFVLHFTKGLQTFGNVQPTLAGSGLIGFIKMLSAEYRMVTAKAIDIDFEVSINAAEVFAETIFRELRAQDRETEICYRAAQRFRPYWRELQLANAKFGNTEPLALDPAKVFVITGGTRGIGAEISRYLVARGVRKLVLMGVRDLPSRTDWELLLNDPESDAGLVAKIRLIKALEAEGTQVELYIGSLINKTGLTRFFADVRKRWGALGGVVHCAGLNRTGNPAFINKRITDIRQVYEPKVAGLEILHEVFAEDDLDFFILCSSVAAIIPALAVGISDYAAANAFMDYYAAYQFSTGDRRFKSINWPSWKETGMGEVSGPAYRKLGLVSHTTAEGLLMLERVIGLSENSSIFPCMVSKTNFDARALIAPASRELDSKPSGSGPDQPSAASLSSHMISETQQWLKKLLAEELNIREAKLDAETRFDEFGVDSIIMMELIKRVEAKLGRQVEPSAFLEHATLASLSRYLTANFLRPDPEINQTAGVTAKTGFVTQTAEQSPRQSSSLQLPANNETPKIQAAVDAQSGTKIAVIGMACHFPGASNKEEYWRNLTAGKSSIREVPRSRWDISRFYRAQYQEGKSISKWGGFIADIEYFDPGCFGISEADAPQLDPLIRQFLEISWETIHDAGYTKEELWNRRVGVFVGSRAGAFANKLEHSSKNSVIGIGQNFIAALVSHCLNFKGPNLVVDTACSSSLVSLHLACQSLILEESELALAGGVDILLDEKPYLVLSEGRALSPDGKCHTFDAKANGFVPGEGCGAVLLKPLERAIADGDQVYAVIEASAVNNDGHTMGVTTPNQEAQMEVIAQALNKARVSADSVSYVETHGTGTMIGDPIELKALTGVFRQFSNERQFCGVGSVKTNLGHLLSAAGIASFIKVVLALYHQQLPPSLNCETPNPRFKFEQSPFYPVLALAQWEPRQGIRRAGISSFGFGGTNAHLIVSEGHPWLPKQYLKKKNALPPVAFHRKRYWINQRQTQNGALSNGVNKQQGDLENSSPVLGLVMETSGNPFWEFTAESKGE